MKTLRKFINRIYAFFDSLNFLKNPIINGLLRAFLSFLLMFGLVLLVYFTSIPNPNMILITGLVICSAVFGLPGGIVSSITMIIYSMFFFSKNHSFFNYTQENLNKLIVIIVGALTSMTFVILFRRRARKEQSELKSIVHYDALTGIKNRHAFRNDVKKYYGTKISFMIIDVDDFKNINDNFGHQKGDMILKLFANLLAEAFDKEEVYRYGGDEFIVLSSADEKLFKNQIENFKESLSNNQEYPMKFSAGYVHGIISEDSDINRFTKLADKNLYESKQSGKNCYKGTIL